MSCHHVAAPCSSSGYPSSRRAMAHASRHCCCIESRLQPRCLWLHVQRPSPAPCHASIVMLRLMAPCAERARAAPCTVGLYARRASPTLRRAATVASVLGMAITPAVSMVSNFLQLYERNKSFHSIEELYRFQRSTS